MPIGIYKRKKRTKIWIKRLKISLKKFYKKHPNAKKGKNNGNYGIHKFGKDAPGYGSKHPHSEKAKRNIKNGLRKSKKQHIHHVDLNVRNNKNSNIIKFKKNGRHQQFHRYAYHYLLKKFGIKEIRKYYKWFNKNIRILK